MDDVKSEVRERYGSIARKAGASCRGGSSCCGSASEKIGYDAEQMAAVPDGANLGLGCGNPTAISGLKPGEAVLDLGSGAGFDCFLAANSVVPQGAVIGVDMTEDMIALAQKRG